MSLSLHSSSSPPPPSLCSQSLTSCPPVQRSQQIRAGESQSQTPSQFVGDAAVWDTSNTAPKPNCSPRRPPPARPMLLPPPPTCHRLLVVCWCAGLGVNSRVLRPLSASSDLLRACVERGGEREVGRGGREGRREGGREGV
jgi:hypothetical protein